MKYDPIMCMMVDDSVKTKDEAFIIEAKKQGHPYKAIVNGEEKDLIKYYTHKGFTDIKLTKTAGKDSNTIDKAIRSCDSREDDIAGELFDALQQIGKRNINKNEAEFISEKFFDGKVSVDELMRIFNKYKKEYL